MIANWQFCLIGRNGIVSKGYSSIYLHYLFKKTLTMYTKSTIRVLLEHLGYYIPTPFVRAIFLQPRFYLASLGPLYLTLTATPNLT
jgi:hypothetical protein